MPIKTITIVVDGSNTPITITGNILSVNVSAPVSHALLVAILEDF